MTVKLIPDGYHTVTPYMMVEGANKLIDFLKEAFGAQEIHRISNRDNSIGRVAMRTGDSMLMLFDARDQWKPMSFCKLSVCN